MTCPHSLDLSGNTITSTSELSTPNSPDYADPSCRFYHPNDKISYRYAKPVAIEVLPRTQDTNSNKISSDYVNMNQFRQYYANKSENPDVRPPSLFMGKHSTYPIELNNLMNPFFCELCNARLNSIKSANIHYESKSHDRHITAWIKKNFKEKGLKPPEVQRFVTEEASSEVPVEHRCEMCNLDLTSVQHALQHFNGKRHRVAVTKINPPTGIGYFNVTGKWVQTGEVIDKATGKKTSYILVKTSSGFEPVVLQKAPTPPSVSVKPLSLKKHKLSVEPSEGESLEKKIHKELPSGQNSIDVYPTEVLPTVQLVASKSNVDPQKQKKFPKSPVVTPGKIDVYQTLSLDSQESPQRFQSPQEALDTCQCKICGISTTCSDQMLLHLKGTKHSKKLKALGEVPISLMFQSPATTIINSLITKNSSDTSMYRTPSGSYYCKPCNFTVQDDCQMKQHIASKKHINISKQHSNLAKQSTTTVEQ